MADAAIIQQFFIVERIHLWDSLKLQDGTSMAIDTKSLGFCPVYDDEEKAKKDFPNDDIHKVVISFKPKQQCEKS